MPKPLTPEQKAKLVKDLRNAADKLNAAKAALRESTYVLPRNSATMDQHRRRARVGACLYLIERDIETLENQISNLEKTQATEKAQRAIHYLRGALSLKLHIAKTLKIAERQDDSSDVLLSLAEDIIKI